MAPIKHQPIHSGRIYFLQLRVVQLMSRRRKSRIGDIIRVHCERREDKSIIRKETG